MSPRSFASLALLVLGLTACGKQQKGVYEVAVPAAAVDPSSAEALKAEADALWAERGDGEKLKGALAKYESLLAAQPTNREVAAMLARGWYFYGDTFVTEDERLAAWDKSISFGKQCIAGNTEFVKLLEKGDETEATAVRVLTAADAPCLYWTSTALGKWAKMQGLGTTLKHIGTVEAYMKRVSELTPEYFYHAPDRYWGAYFSLIPSFKGQDVNKSKEHFDRSLAGSPNYLPTKVLVADALAVAKQDKALYRKMLEEVIAASPGEDPNCRAENVAAIEQAKALLAQADDRFVE
jgi:tetratricopeptide (TPR) repeat protein